MIVSFLFKLQFFYIVLICLYFCQKDDEYSLFNFRDSRVPLFGDGFCEDKDADMKDEETKAKQKTEDESKKSTEESDGIENIHEPATDYSIIKKKESNNEEIISEQDINNTIMDYYLI